MKIKHFVLFLSKIYYKFVIMFQDQEFLVFFINHAISPRTTCSKPFFTWVYFHQHSIILRNWIVCLHHYARIMLKVGVLRVISLVFLLLARCRFQTQSSIISILLKTYGETLVKSLRQLEKLDFKKSKAQLNFGFLLTWKKNNVIPKT